MITAIGAMSGCEHSTKKSRTITFKNEAHKLFYETALTKCREQDCYHKALVYYLGLEEDTRECIGSIYDFRTGCVKTECLHEGWITSGSAKIIRMAFYLYCNDAPSVNDYDNAEEKVEEYKKYSVEDIFSCGYARYFWQAILLRYPEYCFYVDWEDLYAENQITRNNQ